MNLDAIIVGLAAGSIYALVAVGFNVLYRPTNVFNFAHGEMIMYGAMLGAVAIGSWGVPWLPAALAVMAVLGALGFVIERVAVSPVLQRSARSEIWIITTLAISLILSDLAGKLWNSTPRLVPPPPFLSVQTANVAGVSVSSYDIALIVGTTILVVLVERLYRTRAGRAVLAVAEDRDAARLRGIDPGKLSRQSFFVGGALAGLTGLLAAPLLFASIGLGPILLVKGFAAAALGGIGNNQGALVAGLAIGLFETIGARFLSPGYQPAIVFCFMLVVLMIRPQGLVGAQRTRTL